MTKSTFSQEVINIKIALGLSNSALAERLGVSKHSVQAWCTGRRSPSEPMKNHVRSLTSLKSEEINKQNDDSKGEQMHLHKIMDLQEQIISQQKEIMNLRETLHNKVFPNALPTWEQVDYDVITYQAYDMEDASYNYFDSYSIVRWKDFFSHLGYYGTEARDVYENHQKAMTKIGATSKNFKTINLLCDDERSKWMVDSVNTYNVFQDARNAGTNIQTMMNINVNYLHKDGSAVPALLYILIDIKLNSSVTKIKFLEIDPERN